MDYKSKYIKYTKKYLNLKNIVNDYDGGASFANKDNIRNSIKTSLGINDQTLEEELNINYTIESAEEIEQDERINFVSFSTNKKLFYELDKIYIDSNTEDIFNFSKELLEYRLTQKLIELNKNRDIDIYNADSSNIKRDKWYLEHLTRGRSFWKKNLFSFLDKYIKIIINELNKGNDMNIGWIVIKKTKEKFNCQALLKELFTIEQESTALILSTFMNSLVMSEENKEKFRININFTKEKNIDDLTGIWKDDSKILVIKLFSKFETRFWSVYKGAKRLIFGLGPSASGKTFLAKKLLVSLSSKSVTFPKCFLSVDGGTSRGLSYLYQLVINTFKILL